MIAYLAGGALLLGRMYAERDLPDRRETLRAEVETLGLEDEQLEEIRAELDELLAT